MSAYQHHEQIQTPTTTAETTVTRRRFSPGQVVGGLVGVVLTVMGMVVVTRTGIDGSMNQPVTELLGTRQSAYVGAFSVIIGLMMVAAASSIGTRGVLAFLGASTLVGGVFVAAASDRILIEIGVSRGAGPLFMVLGAIALAGGIAPSFVRTQRRVDAA